jgi:leucyl aminopeptidase
MPCPPAKDLLVAAADAAAVPLWLVSESGFEQWVASQPAPVAKWLSGTGFHGERQRVAVLPGPDGGVAGAVLGLGKLGTLDELSLWHTAGLSDKIPAADYELRTTTPLSPAATFQAVLGFGYGHYRFDRYRRSPAATRSPRLVLPGGVDVDELERTLQALALARDLVNTPASDLGPAELAEAARRVADQHGAALEVVIGDELLRRNYPAIHAVGRASAQAPRLIDLRWGDAAHPRVTLVGKGVCFDSGGLDLKNSQSMLLMKKDMGGAACALALASLVMGAKLPVRLRVLVPAVENSVSGSAYRPGDVLATRKGLTVEVGNTDAEGRLVLCDALAEADSEQPQLLVDLATLTGAARIALGPDLPALFGNDDALVEAALRAAREQHDPAWHMPLWSPYDEDLGSKIADLNNVSPTSFGGSLVAALFLRRFVGERTPWLHVDLFAWNPKERFGRPVGGEAQCVRALYALIRRRFAG